MHEDEHDPLVGQRLHGRYLVRRKIFEGGMGQVYLAVDVNLRRPVVVKTPSAQFVADESARKRFLREIEGIRTVEHPNIVPVLDAGQEGGVPWYALRFMRGGTLTKRIPHSAEPKALRWLGQVASALDHCHDSGLVHRDVKPSNILFDERGIAYIADFGVAGFIDPADATRLTQTGLMPGSPAYMAPEQALGQDVDGRADQYALAITLYESLAGELPFEGDGPVQIAIAKKRGMFRRLERAAPVHPAAGQVILRALSPRPERRFPTCYDFAIAFMEGLKGTAPRSVGLVPGRRETRRSTGARHRTVRRRSGTPFVGVGVAAVLLIVLFFVFRDQFDRPEVPVAEPNANAEIDVANLPPNDVSAPPAPTEPPPADPEPSAAPSEAPPEPAPDSAPPRPSTAVHVPPPDTSDDDIIEITAPKQGAFVRTQTVQIRGRIRATDAGLVMIDGKRAEQDGDTFVGSANILSEGDAQILIQWFRRDGKSLRQRVLHVVTDWTPPVLQVEGVRDVTSNSPLVGLEGWVEEAFLDTVTVNGEVVSVREDGHFVYEKPIRPGVASTITRLVVVATDLAGNTTKDVVEFHPEIRARALLPSAHIRYVRTNTLRMPVTYENLPVGSRIEVRLLPSEPGVVVVPASDAEPQSGRADTSLPLPHDGTYAFSIYEINAKGATRFLDKIPIIIRDSERPRVERIAVQRPEGGKGLVVKGAVKDGAANVTVTVAGQTTHAVSRGMLASFALAIPTDFDANPVVLEARDPANNRSLHVIDLKKQRVLAVAEARDLVQRVPTQVLDLDGKGALSVRLPGTGAFPDAFTLECWARSEANAANVAQALVSKCDTSGAGLWWRQFKADGADPPVLRTGAIAYDDASQPPAYTRATCPVAEIEWDDWHHLAMCFDGKALTFFLDGKLRASAQVARFRDNDLNLLIGADPTATQIQLPFTGQIDDVRVSRGIRYTKPFRPKRRLTFDRDTVHLIDFEHVIEGHPVVEAEPPFLADVIGSVTFKKAPR